jgi:hypothetical protein
MISELVMIYQWW